MIGSAPAHPWLATIEPLVRALDGAGVTRVYHSCTSTMDEARALAQSSPAAKLMVCVAEEQSQGRGRQGRVWSSSEGALFCTVAMRTRRAGAELAGLSLAVGIALAEWANRAGSAVLVKWPNDLVAVDGRKAAGILIEVLPSGSNSVVLIGIGINLHRPPDLVPHAVSLHALGMSPCTPPQALRGFLPGLYETVVRFDEHGFPPFHGAWQRVEWLRGKFLSVDVGGVVVSGSCQGVTAQGALLLQNARGVSEVVSGHIVGVDT